VGIIEIEHEDGNIVLSKQRENAVESCADPLFQGIDERELLVFNGIE